ncbi:MAG: hypothetical protein JWR67_3077 [Mucilaginibacter sp.]|nr:hypothetical protein [Mucilaginibacter sp.]
MKPTLNYLDAFKLKILENKLSFKETFCILFVILAIVIFFLYMFAPDALK